MAVMDNSTRAFTDQWEYYYGYVDPVFVDESLLTYHKFSIVIIFWIILASFVGFLFLSLNLMSGNGKFRWSHGSNMKGRLRTHTV